MLRRFSIWLLILLALPACRRDSVVGEDGPELGLYLECPGVPEGTRADEGEVPGTADENALHSVLVWIFDSDSHERISSLQLTGDQLPTPGRVRRYAIPVSQEFARTRPDVDIFALANAASVGCTLHGGSTWQEVNDAVFGGNWFGVENPVRSVNPELGLPMTGAGRDLHIEGEEPTLRVQTVRLVRAVSKLRYVFCRMLDEDASSPDVISVDKVTLNGNLIPNSEYLFTASLPYAVVPGSYAPTPIETYGPAQLASNETPEKLAWAGQDPVSYENLLDHAVAEGTLTDWGTMYLRESDKMLTGYVDYSINGVSHTRNFSMAAPGDFARNHTWTLYGYFLSGRNLQLSVRVLPWDYNAWNINFSNHAVQASQFNVDDSTVDMSETTHDHFDVRLLPGTTAKCRLYITAPVGGKLMIRPQGDAYAFIVEPEMADIDPTTDAGCINITVRRNPEAQGDLSGKYITLSFYVELGEREIDANTEILNGKEYRFIL
jgi:hypothetical protein